MSVKVEGEWRMKVRVMIPAQSSLKRGFEVTRQGCRNGLDRRRKCKNVTNNVPDDGLAWCLVAASGRLPFVHRRRKQHFCQGN